MNRQRIHKWYEEYKVGLFRFALSILRNEEAAEDALQEVFLRLLSGKYYPEPGKEQAYLYRAIRNLCYDELRRRKRIQPAEISYVETADFGYIELISSLSPAEREIVTLKIVGNLTNREVARVMGITEQAAKKRYQRAIQKLKEG